MSYNTLVVLAGACLLGALCGAVGTLAVLRRRALLGDAVAHATLPGIVLAFWFTGIKSLPVLLLGGLATGLLGAGILAWIRRHTITKEDAGLALVLSVLFGAGIALSRHVQNTVVDGSQAGLDSFLLGRAAGIVLSDLIPLALAAGFALVGIALFFKEMRLVIFDAEFARSTGIPVARLDFAIMTLVTLAVVVGLPMAGVVLVAALGILPAVAARFWTEEMALMVALAAGIGLVGAGVGVAISASGEGLPTGPLIVLVAGAIFVVSALLAPNRGALAHALRDRRYRLGRRVRLCLRAIAQEPVLAHEAARRLSEAGVPHPDSALREAERRGWVEREGERYRVSPAGQHALGEAVDAH